MKKIIIPIDFSRFSSYAAELALRIAGNKKIKLFFYHLDNVPIIGKSEEEVRLRNRKSIERIMKFIAKVALTIERKRNLVNINFIVESGNSPEQGILDLAKKQKADLIIMGTKGASGIKKVFYGSVASHVLKISEVPVLVVPIKPKHFSSYNLIYSTDLLHTKNEKNRLTPLLKIFGGKMELFYVNYGWAFTKEELMEYKQLKKSGIEFFEKQVTLEKPLDFHLQAYAKKKPGSILAVFHENKNFIEKLLFRNRPEFFAMEMKVPILSLQK